MKRGQQKAIIKRYGWKKAWKWRKVFSQRGLTFAWPLVLTAGTFYRKVILTSEAWAGWDFLQKCSWRPVWAGSPPNLVTAIVKKNNQKSISFFVWTCSSRAFLPVNRCTLRGLRDSEVSLFIRFGAENSWVSSSWMLLQQIADRETEYYTRIVHEGTNPWPGYRK